MGYNLTDIQKDAVRWLVQGVRSDRLSEEFVIVWTSAGPIIHEYKGEKAPDNITEGTLSALEAAGMLVTTQQQHSLRCTLTGTAYQAVESNFVPAPSQSASQVTIGAIIRTMSGGSVQAVGSVQDSEIAQIVNDPDLLCARVEDLSMTLLNEVKSVLNASEFADYRKAVQELQEQVLAEKPSPSLAKRLAQTIGFLGDIDGSIELMAKVWPFIWSLLVLIAAKLG